MRRLFACALAAALLLLAACGGGGGKPGPGPADKFTLSGTVLSPGGLPLEDVAVLLGLDTKATSAAGGFSFPDLSAGAYTISLQAQNGDFICQTVTLAEDQTSFEFQLPPSAPDFSVTEVEPRLGAVADSLDPQIVLRCNGSVDPASVSPADFSFTPDLSSLDIEVVGSAINLRSRNQLALSQLQSLTYTGEIRALNGAVLAKPVRMVFRTPAVDNAAPRLLSSQPAEGASGYPTNLSLRFGFNEPLEAPELSLQVDIDPPTATTARVSGSTLLISASDGWAVETAYTVTLSGIRDQAGNAIVGSLVLHFTSGTAAAPLHNIQPQWNRVLDRIFFAGDQLGSYDIYSINDDGTDLSLLSSDPEDELHPSVSSDGQLICYQARGSGGDWDIFVGPADGSTAATSVTATSSNDTQPVFSRTFSRNIFFVSDRVNPQAIYMMGENGSAPTILAPLFNSTQSEPAPHPLLDTQLLFTSARSGSADIWRMTVSAIDGSATSIDLTNDLISQEHSPDWSADASFLVYITDRAGVDNVWLVDSAGSIPRQVTNFAQAVTSVALSPFVGDARAVVSMPSDSGGEDLYVIELVGGTIVQQLTGEGS